MSKPLLAMARHHACLLPLCALLVFAPPARAAGPAYASASTTWSDFHFSVVDLAPGDGVAPSVQFGGGAQTQLTAYDSPIFPTLYDFKMIDGAWDGGWPLATASIPGAVSSISSEGMVAQAFLDADLLNTGDHTLTGATNALLASAWNPDPGRFTLGAHTALVLEGTFGAQAQLDLAALAQHPALAGQDAWSMAVEASSSADLLVYQAGSYDLLGEARLRNEVSGVWHAGGQATVVRDPERAGPSASQSFVLRIENNSDTALDALIALTLLSHVQAQVDVSPVPEPAAVPATLAGIGTVLAACLLRPRRRKA
ncbi:MAG TPA: hypothetical protein H9903_15255 [Candidatus Aquabacterium excrementipullorum]|nr:hypothetical protein [Candidatus Aquabacterium excrementipullorum]